MKREHGFTLVELLATMLLMSIVLTLGVSALRYYWLGQSLYNERDRLFTNLRAAQQQVVSESNPLVFGAWFRVTQDGAPRWGTFRYRPGEPAATPAIAPSCTSTGQYTLGGGVLIESAAFADELTAGVRVDDPGGPVPTCRTQVPASADATDFVFFLARGTATAGCITLTQPNRDMEDVTIAVSALTGRVERISQDEVATRC